jgi:hypothetical protein
VVNAKLRYNIEEFSVKGNGDDQQQSHTWLKPFWFLFTVGWFVAFSVIIPLLIGYWLDQPEQLNSKPLYTLIGFGIGWVIAFCGLFVMLRRFYLEQKQTKVNNKEQ